MAGQKFQYDESGSTFFYFLLSFLALVLVPTTYIWWPRKKKDDAELRKKDCHCEHCIAKHARLKHSEPFISTKAVIVIMTRIGLVLGWMLFAYVAYKTTQFDYEYANFDPYEILQVDPGTSTGDIKKAYRKLSLIYHPDKETGDEKTFMKLTKAYEALTDETARRNWELYGNPDGPSATMFGIALPSWIVEKENAIWVLGVYALVFMVALPVAVGSWWYRSIRYSGEQVLLDTTQMYYYFFHKTPHMVLKRTIMVLAASPEFHKRHNPEILERPSDNFEVPQLMKHLPQLNEKNKERPLCFSYSVKARALLHAHLTRIPLPPNSLEIDRAAVVRKCPLLLQEMVTCVAQLMMLAHAGRISRMPSLSTIEGCMKLSAMITQALWDYKSPMLQLPHLEEDMLKYFSSKKHNVKTLEGLARMQEDDRRTVLRGLTDDQYSDVVKVLAKIPSLEMHVQCEVVDDENPSYYTAGAIVTVTVTLFRKPLGSLFNKEGQLDDEVDRNNADEEEQEEEKEDKEEEKKKSAWKPAKKAKKSKKPAKKSTPKPVTKKAEESNQKSATKEAKETKENNKAPASDESEGSDGSEGSEDEEETAQEDQKEVNSAPEDDDAEWEKFQSRLTRRERALEGKSKLSHSVHCPFFPEDKQEYWWVYIADRKQQLLLTAPYHVTNLVEREELTLRFTAPLKPGLYTFSVLLRSDSYLGLDQCKDIKMDVKEAAEIPTEHPQWELADEDEKEDEEEAEESEYATDEDVEPLDESD